MPGILLFADITSIQGMVQGISVAIPHTSMPAEHLSSRWGLLLPLLAYCCQDSAFNTKHTRMRQTDHYLAMSMFFIAYLLQSPPSLGRALVTAMVMGEADANDTNTFLWLRGMADLLYRWKNFYPWDGHWDLARGWMVLVECPLEIGFFLESLGSSVHVCKQFQVKSYLTPLSLESASKFCFWLLKIQSPAF